MTTTALPGRFVALIIATCALVITFWAWSLLGPLASQYAVLYSLSPIDISIMLAIPIFVGSIGRIFLGSLSDRYGGRRVFGATCFASLVPVLLLMYANSYHAILIGGLLLGISGATFAIGIPFISAWFPPEQRGFALGIYGMGNIGVAVSSFFTPRIALSQGTAWAYIAVAVSLAVMGTIIVTLCRNSPLWEPTSGSATKRLAEVVRMRMTWDLSLLYALTFGAFVAFGIYLPVLLKIVYGLSVADAATRAAGFVVLATIARPLGGLLSDRFGGERITKIVLILVALCAFGISFEPPLMPVGTALYLLLGFTLGCGNGAIFALVGKLSPPKFIGGVTGVVGACGGLGGFFPPLILGFSYQLTGSYAVALLPLSCTALLLFFYAHKRFPAERAVVA